MRTVFKVVGKRDGALVSAWVGGEYNTPFSLTYVPDKVTKAPKGTSIFTFGCFDAAERWARNVCNNYEIWEAIGTLSKTQKHRNISSSILVSGITTIAELVSYLQNMAESQPITGTVFCSAITLTKRIN